MFYTLVYGFLFTELGYGATVFNFLSTFKMLELEVQIVSAGLFFVIYMLDIRSWSGEGGKRPAPLVWYTLVLSGVVSWRCCAWRCCAWRSWRSR